MGLNNKYCLEILFCCMTFCSGYLKRLAYILILNFLILEVTVGDLPYYKTVKDIVEKKKKKKKKKKKTLRKLAKSCLKKNNRNVLIFFLFLLKHRSWVHVRTASPRRVPTIYVLEQK